MYLYDHIFYTKAVTKQRFLAQIRIANAQNISTIHHIQFSYIVLQRKILYITGGVPINRPFFSQCLIIALPPQAKQRPPISTPICNATQNTSYLHHLASLLHDLQQRTRPSQSIKVRRQFFHPHISRTFHSKSSKPSTYYLFT